MRSRRRSLLWLLAAALHALLFAGVYQSGFTREEVHALVRPGPYRLLEPYVEAARRHGPLGLIRTYYFGESDDRLYLEYARLVLHGELDLAHVEKVQRRSAAHGALPARPWPYRDIAVEYPPLALLAMVPPALLSDEYGGYRYAFASFMLLLHLANLALAHALLRPRGAATTQGATWLAFASFAFCLLLGRIVATRMDHLVVTFCLSCAWAGARALSSETVARARWAALAGLLGGLGVMTKLVPGLAVLALLIVLARSRSPDRLRLALAACGAGGLALLVINGAMFAWAGPQYLETVRYHTLRGVQLESVYAGALAIARAFGLPVQLEESFGSTNLVSPATRAVQLVSPWLFAAAAVAIGLRRWQATGRSLVLLTTALLLAFMLTNRVFSPQYLIWIAPPLLAAGALDPGGRWRRLCVAFLAIAFASQLIYPQGYPVLKAFHPLAVALLNLRNLALIVLAVAMVRWASAPAHRNV